MRNDVGVIVGMLGDDSLEDGGEFWGLLQGAGSWGEGGRGAKGDFRGGRVGGEESEDVATEAL